MDSFEFQNQRGNLSIRPYTTDITPASVRKPGQNGGGRSDDISDIVFEPFSGAACNET